MTTDWIRKFPLQHVPESWTLNEVFLDRIAGIEAAWRERGISIKLGAEIDFDVRSKAQGQRRVDVFAPHPILSARRDVLRLLEQQVAAAKTPRQRAGVFEETLSQVRAYLRDDPDARALAGQLRSSVEEMADDLDRFEAGLKDPRPAMRDKARTDIFLAYLHTMPADRGGIRDLIEPRFGDQFFGMGWYDCPNPEIRTPVMTEPLRLIEQYHRLLQAMYAAAPRFGLVIDQSAEVGPQIHVSLWRNGENMMAGQSEEAAVFCEHVIRGYHHALSALPFMAHDTEICPGTRFEFSAGSSRNEFVRQESDNWEIRNGNNDPVTHVARHLALLMTGIEYGLNNDLERLRALEPNLTMEREIHPVVRHRFDAHASALVSTLEHCTIDDQGNLTANSSVIAWNKDRMVEEIGPENADKFVSVFQPKDVPDQKPVEHDLTSPVGWCDMFRIIKIGENGLDLSRLASEPDLVEALSVLDVTGRRTALWVPPTQVESQKHNLAQALEDARESEFFQTMFLPEERNAIQHYYGRQWTPLNNLRGRMLVEAFEQRVRRRKPDLARAPGDKKHYSTGKLIDEFIHDVFDSANEDEDLSFNILFSFMEAINERTAPRTPRSKFFNDTFYINSTLGHFNRAAAFHAERLKNRNQIDDAYVADLLEQCVRTLNEEPRDPGERMLNQIKYALESASVEKLRENGHGIEDGLRFVSTAAGLVHFRYLAAAVFDKRISTFELRQSIRRVVQQLPEKLVEFDAHAKREKKDFISKVMHDATRNISRQSIHNIHYWVEEILIDDLLLPAPQKPNGP